MPRGAMAGDELVIKMSQPAAIGPDRTAIPIDRKRAVSESTRSIRFYASSNNKTYILTFPGRDL